MHVGFEADAAHAHGVGDAALIVHDVALRQGVDDFAVQRDGNGLGRVEHALHVLRGDFAAALDGDDAVAVHTLDVTASDTRVNIGDLAPGHELGFFHGLADGLHGLVDVHHHALAQAFRGTRTYADDIDPGVGRFADNSAYLGRTNIEADNEFGVWHR